MPPDYPIRPRLCRAFLVVPYTVDAAGQMDAVMPSRCPAGVDPSSGGECELALHHRRARKTGPGHALCVVECREHEVAFTLYPPGYAPYRRQAVLKLTPEGEPIGREGSAVAAEFEDTVFAAALDAKEGKRWARETKAEVPERWWSTQGRHLQLTSRLVGVASDLADKIRESIATVLSVGLLSLRELSAKGYRALGAGVCSVLGWLQGRGCARAQQLLICGHLIGHWGEPLHWDATRQVLMRSPFCVPGMSPPT